jgi:flagellar biosynthesis protein FliP
MMGRLLLLFLGLILMVPAAAHADTNSAQPTSQHESSEHNSTKAMKAYKKQQKKYQKQTRKAEQKAGKNARKKGKQQRESGH